MSSYDKLSAVFVSDKSNAKGSKGIRSLKLEPGELISLKTLQNLVGGNIQILELQNGKSMIINEEGSYTFSPNPFASSLMGFKIYGPAVLLDNQHLDSELSEDEEKSGEEDN